MSIKQWMLGKLVMYGPKIAKAGLGKLGGWLQRKLSEKASKKDENVLY